MSTPGKARQCSAARTCTTFSLGTKVLRYSGIKIMELVFSTVTCLKTNSLWIFLRFSCIQKALSANIHKPHSIFPAKSSWILLFYYKQHWGSNWAIGKLQLLFSAQIYVFSFVSFYWYICLYLCIVFCFIRKSLVCDLLLIACTTPKQNNALVFTWNPRYQ